MGDLSEPLLRLKQKLPQLAGLGAEPEKQQRRRRIGSHRRAGRATPAREENSRDGQKNAARYNRPPVGQTLLSASFRHAHTLYRHFRMGLPELEARFYPEKLAQKKFLNFYASKLNAVEVNYTFRQLVKETTVQNWIADTPEQFRFTIKAHQVLTHIKRLKNSENSCSYS